jgi:hypothetical protein
MEEFKPYKTDDFGEHYQHPTFGVINFSRGQGGSRPLFGSSILHNERITLEIKHAELGRDLHRDWIYGHNTIIEVEMSPTQFADAITSLNNGSGTPVTIRYIAQSPAQHLERIDPPFESKVAQFNKEFDTSIKDIGKRFDTAISLAKETKAQKRLISELEQLKMHFVSNLPFVNKSFSEQMEKTVTEAKGEVEAFVKHTIENYGIEAIRNQAPQLPDSIPIEVKELTNGDEVDKVET